MLAIVHIGTVRRASGRVARFIRPDGDVWRGKALRASASFGGPNLHQVERNRSVGPIDLYGEFDPGSGRTLAVRLTHASRTVNRASARGSVANGCVTRGQPAPDPGITPGNRS